MAVMKAEGISTASKADDRRAIKLADFVGQFYRTPKNQPIFV